MNIENILDLTGYYNIMEALGLSGINGNEAVFLASLSILFGVCLVLRLIIFFGSQISYANFKLSAKPIVKKDEIKNTMSIMLNNMMKDYVLSGEKGASNIDTEKIVTKHISRLNFIFWKYTSIELFVSNIEKIIPIAVIAALLITQEYKFGWVFLGFAYYILIKLAESIFNYKYVTAKLLAEATEYINRELGQFYSTDMGTSLKNFKTMMQSIILSLTDNLKAAIEKLGVDVSGVLKLSSSEMQSSVTETMSKINTITTSFSEPISVWNNSVAGMKSVLEDIKAASGSFEKTCGQMNAVCITFNDSIEKQTNNISDIMLAQAKEIKEDENNLAAQSKKLFDVISDMNIIAKAISERNEFLQAELTLLRQNQTSLDISLQQYQGTLENVTARLGDAFSNIVKEQGEALNETLTQNMQNNLNSYIAQSNDLYEKMQSIFNQLYEQSKTETQALIKMKEQIDISIGEIKQDADIKEL